MSATTASTGQSVPVSLEAMRRVMIELQLAAPPEWMLIAPDGRVFKGDQRTVARALLMNIDVASLFGATPAAPSQEPAVPQGNDPAWTLAAKVREALDRKACPGYYMDVAVEAVVHNYAPAAPSQPVTCGLCQGSGVLGPTQKCICQYGG